MKKWIRNNEVLLSIIFMIIFIIVTCTFSYCNEYYKRNSKINIKKCDYLITHKYLFDDNTNIEKYCFKINKNKIIYEKNHYNNALKDREVFRTKYKINKDVMIDYEKQIKYLLSVSETDYNIDDHINSNNYYIETKTNKYEFYSTELKLMIKDILYDISH